MSKRILAAFLWFFAGWYVGAFVAYLFGVTELLGPVLGAALAAVVAGDPWGRIWRPARQAEQARAVANSRLADLPSTR
jgi:hypothetical protein